MDAAWSFQDWTLFDETDVEVDDDDEATSDDNECRHAESECVCTTYRSVLDPVPDTVFRIELTTCRSLASLLTSGFRTNEFVFGVMCFACSNGKADWLHEVFRRCNTVEIPSLRAHDSKLLRIALDRIDEAESYQNVGQVYTTNCGCARMSYTHSAVGTRIPSVQLVDTWNCVLLLLTPPCTRCRLSGFVDQPPCGARGIRWDRDSLPNMGVSHSLVLRLAVQSRSLDLFTTIMNISDVVYKPLLHGVTRRALASEALKEAVKWASSRDTDLAYSDEVNTILSVVCARLIDNGEDLPQADAARCTDSNSKCLFLAASVNAVQVMRWLVSTHHRMCGDFYRVKANDDNNSALHFAFESGHFEAVTMLTTMPMGPHHVCRGAGFLECLMTIPKIACYRLIETEWGTTVKSQVPAFTEDEQRRLYNMLMGTLYEHRYMFDDVDLKTIMMCTFRNGLRYSAECVVAQTLPRVAVNSIPSEDSEDDEVYLMASDDDSGEHPLYIALNATYMAVKNGGYGRDLVASMRVLDILCNPCTKMSPASRLSATPQDWNDRCTSKIVKIAHAWGGSTMTTCVQLRSRGRLATRGFMVCTSSS